MFLTFASSAKKTVLLDSSAVKLSSITSWIFITSYDVSAVEFEIYTLCNTTTILLYGNSRVYMYITIHTLW